MSWLCRYLGRLSDADLRDALDASGATAEETDRVTRAIRSRIEQLAAAAATD